MATNFDYLLEKELFGEFAELMGLKLDANTLYGTLYRKALEGDKDCAGLLAYNF